MMNLFYLETRMRLLVTYLYHIVRAVRVQNTVNNRLLELSYSQVSGANETCIP